jgi:ribosomal protein S18 acetylase RimI-like enzyme
LVESHSVDSWRRTLTDPQRAIWLAVLEGVPIAFIAVGACKLPIENREPNAGEIQMLYVLATHHNLRLGSSLMDLGLEWLRSQNKSPLYIGVWSENFGAQRFYGRYGFERAGEYGFRVGNTVDHEFILKR